MPNSSESDQTNTFKFYLDCNWAFGVVIYSSCLKFRDSELSEVVWSNILAVRRGHQCTRAAWSTPEWTSSGALQFRRMSASISYRLHPTNTTNNAGTSRTNSNLRDQSQGRICPFSQR